jgi:hypothetical protein
LLTGSENTKIIREREEEEEVMEGEAWCKRDTDQTEYEWNKGQKRHLWDSMLGIKQIDGCGI